MTDPPRLADDANAPGSALLRAAQRDMPPGHVLERTLAAVAVGGAASVVSTAVAAKTTAKAGATAIAKWALVGFASGVVAIGGAEVIHYEVTNSPATARQAAPSPDVQAGRSANPPKTRDTSPGTELPSPSPPKAVFDEPPESQAHRAQPTRGAVPSAGASVRAPHPLEAPSTPPSPAMPSAMESFEVDSATAVEVRLLDEARSALAQGRNNDALAALGRYAREAPSRRLAPEAFYLEMETNRALGDHTAALRSARALLDRYPDGPHAARARRILRGE